MNNEKKLSVIVPIYNTERYLEKCLDSIYEAIRDLDAEVLLINDGSPDRCGEIARRYAARHPTCFCYFEKANGGLADVKNYGLACARGEYIIFCDSDDYVEPEIYSEMLRAAQLEQADCVVCDIWLEYEQTGRRIYEPCYNAAYEGPLAQLLNTQIMAASWNKLVRRELMHGLEFPAGKNNEDVAVTPIVLARAENICVIKKPFYHYVQRAGSIQNSTFDEKRFVLLQTAQLTLQRAAELPEAKRQLIHDSICWYQVLGLALWPIRREPFGRRWRLLRSYMPQAKAQFPGMLDVPQVQEYCAKSGRAAGVFWRVSLLLLREKQFFMCALWWQIGRLVTNK